MLVNPKQMILRAQGGKYAIGSFNTSNLEITQAIVAAAEKMKAPVIIETSEKAIAYAGLKELASIIKAQAEKASVPIALHLDHGSSLEVLSRCIENGYTSVMYDGSKLSFVENQIITRQAADTAHRNKVTCEGELGSITTVKTSPYPIVNEKGLTDPKQVPEFVKNTGIDFLAVSVGTQHGIGDEHVDIKLLKKIKAKTYLPLVLHGSSGLDEENIKEAIANGITKINVDTDIRRTFSHAMREVVKKTRETDPRELFKDIMAEVQKLVEEKIKIFGSEGKADEI